MYVGTFLSLVTFTYWIQRGLKENWWCFTWEGCTALNFKLGSPVLDLQKVWEYLCFENKAHKRVPIILSGFQGWAIYSTYVFFVFLSHGKLEDILQYFSIDQASHRVEMIFELPN